MSHRDLETVERYFSRDENVLFLMEVGGTLQKTKAKDIDYIIIVSDKLSFKNKLSKIFGKICVLDDSYRVLERAPQLNFAIFDETDMISKIEQYKLRSSPLSENREWVIGYWIPEIFIEDILNGQILINHSKKLKNVKKYFSKSKSKILENYRLKIKSEIAIKSNLLLESEFFFEKGLLKNDLILALVRYIQICVNREYLNFSKIIKKQRCFIEKLFVLNEEKFLIKITEIIDLVDKGDFYAIDFWNMEA